MIIAVVGMPGSGKSVCIESIAARDIPVVYFGGQVIKEVERRGLDVSEENERTVREELRSEHGMAAMAYLSLPEIKEHLKQNNDVALDGLYSYSEYKVLKEKFDESLVVIGVVVDKHKRYDRLHTRPHRPLTKEEVQARDTAEIEQLEKAPPIALADYYLLNNPPIDKYEQAIESLLDEILES